MTAPQRSVSSFSQLRIPSGVSFLSSTNSAPSSVMRCIAIGSVSAMRTAVLILSSASFGVPLGARHRPSI
jgi:hypothetical protein